MEKDKANYEERLTTIAVTRLIYNTMSELEDMLDTHSLHNNGVKRSFSSPAKMRAAYRDLKVEVSLMTDNQVDLDNLLVQYKRAWTFVLDNLSRRSNPEQTVLEILSYCYIPYYNGFSGNKTEKYKQIVEQKINVPILILMLLKVVPGPSAKGGDVIDMPRQYEYVMQFLESFVSKGAMLSIQPTITKAREEKNKTRLMLLYHVAQILSIYKSYSTPNNMYEASYDTKASTVDLDIAGYWNECGGRLDSTDFWQIEDALANGTYFMTFWHKDSDNQLTGIRYALFIFEGADGNLVYYMLHPEAIKHRMKGLQYGDSDQVWYKTAMLANKPSALPLQRMMFSGVWPSNINLTRCTDQKVISQYDKWFTNCKTIKRYQHLEYDFHPNLYAVTQTHLYIPSENEGEYYKVPKSAYEGLEHIQIGDAVGLMTMNGQIYLAFDELMLYISTSKKELEKYHIERVNCIS